jgi:hypothetical protein
MEILIMGIRNFLFGDKRRKPSETIAKLRAVINRYELKSRAIRRKADEQRSLAIEMVRDGNKMGAKKSLLRRQLYLKKLESTENKILNINRVIETIETVKDNIELSGALREADVVINEGLREVGPEVTEELMVRLEEGMERAAMADEALSDVTSAEAELDLEIEESIDAEIAAMESQLLAAEGVTTEPASRTSAEKPKETRVAGKEKLEAEEAEIEKEIKLLKKQLETSSQ